MEHQIDRHGARLGFNQNAPLRFVPVLYCRPSLQRLLVLEYHAPLCLANPLTEDLKEDDNQTGPDRDTCLDCKHGFSSCPCDPRDIDVPMRRSASVQQSLPGLNFRRNQSILTYVAMTPPNTRPNTIHAPTSPLPFGYESSRYAFTAVVVIMMPTTWTP